MSEESLRLRITIDASVTEVFDVLASPEQHLRIDGTGWLAECLDPAPLVRTGQTFRILMHHDDHPDKNYLMENRVVVLDRPRTIGWMPGQAADDGTLELGGWTWRYDLAPLTDRSTAVTLSYDWSDVPAANREHIEFPPFPVEYLEDSLRHLGQIATGAPAV